MSRSYLPRNPSITGEGRLRDVFSVEALQDALRRDALDAGQDPQDVEAGHHQAVPRQPQLDRCMDRNRGPSSEVRSAEPYYFQTSSFSLRVLYLFAF